MATFTEDTIRARAQATTLRAQKSAKTLLEEAATSLPTEFDVFLSYSSQEPIEVLLGVKEILKDYGLTVYVDKFDDPNLTPDNVTKATAEMLRKRLRQSKSLLFLHSESSKVSKWMPWELGYFDGYRAKVGILPVTKTSLSKYLGQEYLGVYPYVGKARDTEGKERLWIWEAESKYAVYPEWVKGKAEIKARSTT